MAYKQALMLGIGTNFCVESRRGLLADSWLGFSALALATPAGNLLQEGVGEGKERERERVTSLAPQTSKHANTSTSYPELFPQTKGGEQEKSPGKEIARRLDDKYSNT